MPWEEQGWRRKLESKGGGAAVDFIFCFFPKYFIKDEFPNAYRGGQGESGRANNGDYVIHVVER